MHVDNGLPTRVERVQRPQSAFGSRPGRGDTTVPVWSTSSRGHTGSGRPTSAFGARKKAAVNTSSSTGNPLAGIDGELNDGHDDDPHVDILYTEPAAASNSRGINISTRSHWTCQSEDNHSSSGNSFGRPHDEVTQHLIRAIDTVFISSWLCSTKHRLNTLRGWWRTSTNALGFAEFWLNKCGDSERERLIRPVFTAMLHSIHDSISTKEKVGYTDLEHLVKALLPEFEVWLGGGGGGTAATTNDAVVLGGQQPRPPPTAVKTFSDSARGRKSLRRRTSESTKMTTGSSSAKRTSSSSLSSPSLLQGGHLYLKQICDLLSTNGRRFRRHLSNLKQVFADETSAQCALALRSWALCEMAFVPVEKYAAMENGVESLLFHDATVEDDEYLAGGVKDSEVIKGYQRLRVRGPVHL